MSKRSSSKVVWQCCWKSGCGEYKCCHFCKKVNCIDRCMDDLAECKYKELAVGDGLHQVSLAEIANE